MAIIDLVRLSREDIPEIQDLFERVYPDKENINELYWEYMFDIPYTYIAAGLRYNGLLVGYYAGIKYDWSALCVSAMIDPDFRGLSLFSKLAWYLYDECKKEKVDYITLFANKNIHDIYPKYGWKDIYQMREYRIPIKDIKPIIGMWFYPKKYVEGSFEEWRYKNHPYNTYIYYEKIKDGTVIDYVIYSTYEDRLQIINYNNLDVAIKLGAFIGKLLDKEINTIAFWSEKKLKYPFIKLDLWYMYKNYYWFKDKVLKKYLKTEQLYMGLSDVF